MHTLPLHSFFTMDFKTNVLSSICFEVHVKIFHIKLRNGISDMIHKQTITAGRLDAKRY